MSIMKTLYNYNSVDCENIEGYEIEPDWYADIQKVEAAEYENFLVNSGYYNRMRCLDE